MSDDARPDHDLPPIRVVPAEEIEIVAEPRPAGAEPPGHREPVHRAFPAPGPYPPRRVIVLFLLTCLSTFAVGSHLGLGWLSPDTIREAAKIVPLGQLARDGLVYSVCVMSILFSHEMGHFLQSRRHRVPASWPYFIPMPLMLFGTMGAVIFQGAGTADRRKLFDIAVSGPLAGLVVALPVAWFGLQGTTVVDVPPGSAGLILGDPPLLRWMISLVHGPLAANQEVQLTPMLQAGWVGIFITALNLIPIGQLDGGHILYALIGRRAHRVAVLLLLGWVGFMLWSGNPSYLLMVVLLVLMGPRHPPTADDTVPLGAWRIALGWLTLAFLFVGFTPVPIVTM